MKIGIYPQPSWAGLGGSDFVVVTLAQALRQGHNVEIVHQRSGLTIGQLEEFFDLELADVRLRYSPPPPSGWCELGCRIWQLPRELRRWNAELSEPYDLFINVTHGAPPFCHARHGVLYVLFPDFDFRSSRPWEANKRGLVRQLGGLMRRPVHLHSWRARLATYQTKLAITQFAADWTRRYWGIDCEVVFPPVSVVSPTMNKSNQIAAVGRFDPEKKQAEMVSAFRSHCERLPGWSFHCLGGLHPTRRNLNYYREVQVAAGSSPTYLHANASRSEICAMLACSKIFWHGKGLGVNEATRPADAEHFGIATVEAMAAGCVPVVNNRGGQREIVQHGLNGLLCEDLEEMVKWTCHLASDDNLRRPMADAARLRAKEFSREKFVERFLAHLKPIGV